MNADCGIYQVRRVETDQRYIGSSIHMRLRMTQHRGCLRRGSHDSPRLQNSWNKHGEGAFVFEVVEYCQSERLIEREQHYIDTLHPVFNSGCAAAGMRGRKHTDDTRLKMRIASAMRWTPAARSEAALKSTGNTNARGCKRSAEYIERMAARSRGKTHLVSDAARALMSASQMGNRKGAGRVVSVEQRARQSAALKGRVFSPETIARMCASQTARWARKKQMPQEIAS